MKARTAQSVRLVAAASLALAPWLYGVPAPERPTRRELQELADKARRQRLGLERQQVATEIEQGLLFDPEHVAAAVQALHDAPEDTWTDNVERIGRAFAAVAPRFGKAWELYRQGRQAAALAVLAPAVSQRDTTYFAAAKRLLHADALAATGRLPQAVDAYLDLVEAMPDRFSFASLALLRSGETYEKLHRRYYAMSLYRLWVDSFGLLDEATSRELIARAERIEADYRDPLATLARKMHQVRRRLARADSGPDNQRTQQEIIEQLDDLIALLEESPPPRPPPEGQRPPDRPGEQRPPEPPRRLPPPPPPEGRRTETRPVPDEGEWGRLPPRQREKLIGSFRDSLPERYRRMIRDYYRTLARDQRRE